MQTQLKVQNLSYKYEWTAPWVFHDIELTLTPGLYGLLGSNGCGKTTFLKCLAGINQGYTGKINFTLHGKHLKQQHLKEKLGYVPQEFAFYEEFKVDRYLTYIAEMKLMPRHLIAERIDALTAQFNLSDLRTSRIDTLSIGQKRRLMLAQALLADPYLILLDEPLNGLDVEERNQVMELLHGLASTRIVILASHIISEVEQWMEQVIFMVNQQMTPPQTPLQWKMKMHSHNLEPTLEDVLLWLVR